MQQEEHRVNSAKRTQDDSGVEWLFEKARDYPLLSAVEEREIDARKWESRDELLKLLLAESAGRSYLRLWTSNILDNPPSLESIADRSNYYLLRREQGELRTSKVGKEQLKKLHIAFEKAGDELANRELGNTLKDLELSPPLVAGFAQLAVNTEPACEMAQALRDWQASWLETVEFSTISKLSGDDDLRRWLREYFSSRESLVNHNLRLVFSIAKRLATATVAFPDLVQSGIVGLIRASEKYDYRSEHRFSTYAYNWISQAARRFLEEQRAVVRMPANVAASVNRLYRERLSYISINGREPSVQYLADKLGTEPETVREWRSMGNLSVSLDQPSDNDPAGLTMGEKMSGWTYPAPALQAEQKSLHRCLMSSLYVLTKQEQKVITLRWGLSDMPALSRREIAAQFDVSTERIRQIESSALDKLRKDKVVKQAYRDYENS
ncbi:sigma-70 family RNA polymerase sigma factor [Halioglobus maricola]|uniref:Sigma-70 family RNA polymerase sigma factor n=1 Tax=Halioglobus maricola TaxID=2601894 RepID=A0A5P9NMP6_9GAMM|nr:sigma-70 family RNA polymerase sigma factor [Halioglobus maricola]QFU76776.1 sigma-70 family RNA polymerase sigma factor [Halioglobus maricola]